WSFTRKSRAATAGPLAPSAYQTDTSSLTLRQISPVVGRQSMAGMDLRGRAYQRRLLRSQGHADPLAVQSADRAGHLAHLPSRTGGILHESDLIGGQDQGFGFQDGLGEARRRDRGEDQP